MSYELPHSSKPSCLGAHAKTALFMQLLYAPTISRQDHTNTTGTHSLRLSDGKLCRCHTHTYIHTRTLSLPAAICIYEFFLFCTWPKFHTSPPVSRRGHSRSHLGSRCRETWDQLSPVRGGHGTQRYCLTFSWSMSVGRFWGSNKPLPGRERRKCWVRMELEWRMPAVHSSDWKAL